MTRDVDGEGEQRSREKVAGDDQCPLHRVVILGSAEVAFHIFTLIVTQQRPTLHHYQYLEPAFSSAESAHVFQKYITLLLKITHPSQRDNSLKSVSPLAMFLTSLILTFLILTYLILTL